MMAQQDLLSLIWQLHPSLKAQQAHHSKKGPRMRCRSKMTPRLRHSSKRKLSLCKRLEQQEMQKQHAAYPKAHLALACLCIR